MEAAPPTFAKASSCAKASEDKLGDKSAGRPPLPFTGEFYSHKKLVARDFKLQSAPVRNNFLTTFHKTIG